MSNKDFKEWADANLAWDEQRGLWIGDDIALSAWSARQPEIDALTKERDELLKALKACITPLEMYRAYGWGGGSGVIEKSKSILAKFKEKE